MERAAARRAAPRPRASALCGRASWHRLKIETPPVSTASSLFPRALHESRMSAEPAAGGRRSRLPSILRLVSRSTKPGYKAFISYSHAADSQLARLTHTALTSFAKPLKQRRALRIYLDKTS